MSEAPSIAVVDYGIGNLHSAQKALTRCGADARLTSDPAEIAAADGVVLPGVGAFGACMGALRDAGLERATLDAATSGRPFLGICVGMQMLFSRSQEDPDVAGLDVIAGTVERIPPGPKVPQMQWNRLDVVATDDPMLAGLGDDAWLYFVHSLHGVPDDADVVAATVEYGSTLNVAFRLGEVFAVQFHPEKSSRPGLALLGNFVEVCAGRSASTTAAGTRR
ncbi:imidazole glycerol phosphate synthase subunit HisH [Ilumatobacter sp.]|uniref:imidazole glycerol phosphate synthase subunit HisH n=1 Tax=Ilumatobacter sp. TaxID=1967498 RepID=UPI003B523333